MSQTLLALLALSCVVILSLHTRRAGHHTASQSTRAEIEARAASVGAEFLDLAATLPFDGSAPPGTGLKETPSLTAWDGRTSRVAVPAGRDSLEFFVRAAVTPVGKVEGAFVEVGSPTPFRRLQLFIVGEQETVVTVERLYAEAVR